MLDAEPEHGGTSSGGSLWQWSTAFLVWAGHKERADQDDVTSDENGSARRAATAGRGDPVHQGHAQRGELGC